MNKLENVTSCEIHLTLDPYCSQCSHWMILKIKQLEIELKSLKEILKTTR